MLRFFLDKLVLDLSPPINLFWSLSSANKKDIDPMFATNHVVALFVVKQENVDSSLKILNALSSTSSSVSCSLSSFHPSFISSTHNQQSSKNAGKSQNIGRLEYLFKQSTQLTP